MSTAGKSSDTFARNLKKARENRKLSQSELARKLGLVPSAIAHFEGNRRKPSFVIVRELAKALNVSSDFLLGRTKNLSGSTTAFRGEEKLSDDDRKFIQQMIDLKNKK